MFSHLEAGVKFDKRNHRQVSIDRNYALLFVYVDKNCLALWRHADSYL